MAFKPKGKATPPAPVKGPVVAWCSTCKAKRYAAGGRCLYCGCKA